MKTCLLSAFVVLGLACNPASADDVYYSARLTDIELEGGTLPAPENRWGVNWRLRPAMRPRVTLDGEGEAYVEINWPGRGWWGSAGNYGDAILAVRVPDARKVTGRLRVARADWDGMQTFRFTLPDEVSSDSARDDFLKAKESTMRHLLERGVPGGAWFRHQLLEVQRARGEKVDPARPRQPGRELRPDELEDTFSMFTGGQAISENLQLDRVFPPQGTDTTRVEVDSIQGISVAEIEWEPLVRDLDPKLDALAALIPRDQHAVFFPTFQALLAVMDEAQERGTPVLEVLEPRAENAKTKERYEGQLCLTVTALSRLLGPKIIASVAMTGSDPYLRTGSDVAMLFETGDPEALTAYLATRHAAALKDRTEAEAVSGEVDNVKYRGVVTPDRSICSHVAVLGKVVVVANSTRQLERVVKASKEKAASLVGLPEYTFFRDRYRAGEAGESAFLILSDAAIRRWCGPRWRIGASRRIRAGAILSELQASYMKDIAGGEVEPGPLHTLYSFPDAGKFRLERDGVLSSTYGTLEFQTPIVELDLDRVTKAEAEAYRRWRDGYQRNWRRYFDPIAVRLGVADDRLEADVSVMPLIAASEYRELIELTADTKIAPNAGDPHPEALVHYVMALNRESRPVKEVSGFMLQIAPGLKTNPLGWLGSSLAIYADADPVWQEAAASEDPNDFFTDNFHRLPLALRVEVSNPLTAAAFLASVRAYVNQTAPRMTIWESLTYKDQPYVKITPASTANMPAELQKLAVYYAVTAESLTLTLNEPLLKRALDRQAERERQRAEDAGGKEPAESPWLGESVCLKADSKVGEILEVTARDHYRALLQLRSWSTLPILNVYRRLHPDKDPVELHEKVWGVRLVCPGGGRYVWNAEWDTMESTAFGHPGAPRPGPDTLWPLQPFRSGNFGITFEEDGLRVRAVLERRKAQKL